MSGSRGGGRLNSPVTFDLRPPSRAQSLGRLASPAPVRALNFGGNGEGEGRGGGWQPGFGGAGLQAMLSPGLA